MSYLIKPKNYKPLLDLKQTELGIKQIKEFFQLNLSSELRLRRVTAPLFVLKGMGINDDLNGIERPVSFPIKDLGDAQAEVVHSLAKWKRLTLADYHIEPGYGIYTDMNAIRSDEELGNLHSLYVDQWDWERVITNEDRTVNFLKEIVNRIYAAMIRTEYMVYEMYPQIKPCLPQKLHFIHSEELRQLYPNLEPKCREHAICQKYGAVFIIGIGCQLGDGKKHDGRAPDYDDYTTKGLNDLPGLNGDLLLWDNVLQRSIELSSMGIRVDKEALQRQLKEEKEEKPVRREKDQIIPHFCFHYPENVCRISLIHFPGTHGVTGTHIHTIHKQSLLCIKRRINVDRIVVFFRTKKSFVILDWQKCCRKEYSTVPLIQTFLQICRRVNTKQLQNKSSILLILRIDDIVLIQPIIYIQERPHLKIKIQYGFPDFFIHTFLEIPVCLR